MGCLFVVIFISLYFLCVSQPTRCGENHYRRNTSNILGALRCTKSPVDILCLRDFSLLLLAAIRTAWDSCPRTTIQVQRQTRLFHDQSPVPPGYCSGCASMHGCASTLVCLTKLDWLITHMP
jgi:hypothetical protein